MLKPLDEWTERLQKCLLLWTMRLCLKWLNNIGGKYWSFTKHYQSTKVRPCEQMLSRGSSWTNRGKILLHSHGFDVVKKQSNLNWKQARFDWIVSFEFLTNGDKSIDTLRCCFLWVAIWREVLAAKSEKMKPLSNQRLSSNRKD